MFAVALLVRVFAAASLSDALTEIGETPGTEVVFNFAGSSTLARQIEKGAPADLFLSADEAQMDALERGGLIDGPTRVSFLSNTLVIVGGGDLLRARRIALADPSSVPAGVYARSYLERIGMWERVRPKVIPVENVRAALAAVEAGNADSAIVYKTDTKRYTREIADGPPISYAFAVTANAKNPDGARAFLQLLQSDAARQIFVRHGFLVLSGRQSSWPTRTESAPLPQWGVLFFTVRVAALASLLILGPGLFVAWLLARRRWRGKSVVETFVALPLVMPPVATGLILLQLFGARGPFGALDIAFTWRAVVLAMMVMSFPLLVRAARVAFEEVNPRLEQIARTLGAGNARVFATITVPLAARGIVSGWLLAFARSLGEFGATILVAGNIPGQTTTISTSIYNLVQLGRDREAFRILLAAVIISFAAVWTAEVFLNRDSRAR
jgi:molybdate transport system permease protein